ncbi:hypothetical protein FIBSPDRAFT_707495, partial [Athelia psychrophila]
LHNHHFHGVLYSCLNNSLKHGDSMHSAPPPDTLAIFAWILADLPQYRQPQEIYEDTINIQGDPGSNGSCAIVAHNFIEYCIADDVPQWTAGSAASFRDQALTELIAYHCLAENSE